MICPKCGNPDVRRSQSSQKDDFLHRHGGRQAYRCRSCRERFFASPGAQISVRTVKQPGRKNHRLKRLDPKKKKRLIRRLIVIGVVVGMLLLFGAFLRYYLLVDHVPPPPEEDGSTTTIQQFGAPAFQTRMVRSV